MVVPSQTASSSKAPQRLERAGLALALIGRLTLGLGAELGSDGDAAASKDRDLASQTPASLPPCLTSVQQVVSLPSESARQGHPVHLQAVVTYCDSEQFQLFVAQEGLGVQVEVRPQKPALKPGQRVAISARTRAGGLAPTLADATIEVIGTEALPFPRRVSFAQVATGYEQAQWVEIAGVVRWLYEVPQGFLLDLVADGQRLSVQVPASEKLSLERFLDAAVRVRGVAVATLNPHGELTRVELATSGLEQITVDRPPLPDPFTAAQRALDEIRRFNPRTESSHRVRTKGVVTFFHRSGAYCFLQEGTASLYVQLWRTPAVGLGDLVEVVGFPDASGFVPYLDQALIRRLGPGQTPPPLRLSFHDATAGQFDTRLLCLRGRLLRVHYSKDMAELTLEDQGTILSAFWLAPDAAVCRRWPERALVDVTGVWSVVREAGDQRRHYRLFLRSPADVTVVSRPAWWTYRHTAVACGLLALVAAAFSGWIAVLRRRMRDQALVQQQLAREAQLERRYGELFDRAHDMIYTHDLEGRLASLNRAGEQITGYTREEACRLNFRDWLSPDCREAFDGLLAGARQGQAPASMELALCTRAGSRVELDLSLNLSREDGRPAVVQGIARNMTERRRAQHELEKLNRELIRTSRSAGMAEVATGVLHNVGNVLNSVNVSTTLAADMVRQSKVTGLGKAAQMLRAHADDLPAFLTDDPKGKLLPGYLTALADHLSVEQAQLLKEMQVLATYVEHIKEIVAMQQSYAKLAGLVESLPPATLVEDALQMNAAALRRHGVEVVRDYQTVPRVRADRHKVLQILLNLIHNAKYAMDADGAGPEKRLTVGVSEYGNGRVRITVQDTGVGIPAENLTRIFAHGFTTKKDGHGFGLHTGALAAKEMGGQLTAASDGLGRGARFTLELPVEAPKDTL